MSLAATGRPSAVAQTAQEQEVERLRWQCRRGMLELDLLLNHFLDRGYDALDAAGRDAFVRLLGYQDQILQDWLIGHAVPAEPELSALVVQIRAAMRRESPGDCG